MLRGRTGDDGPDQFMLGQSRLVLLATHVAKVRGSNLVSGPIETGTLLFWIHF